LEEIDTLGIDEPFFFSSHPALRERIKNFTQLSLAQPSSGGIVAAERFRDMTMGIRITVLESDLASDRCQSVILVLERDDVQSRYPAYAAYYLGEAYRRCGDKNQSDKVVRAYRKAIRQKPDFAPSYHALGVQLFKQRQYEQAQVYLQRYLDLKPDGRHAGYVNHYLQIIGNQSSSP
jgi:tetratricopeptide (TPR) repeat protein